MAYPSLYPDAKSWWVGCDECRDECRDAHCSLLTNDQSHRQLLLHVSDASCKAEQTRLGIDTRLCWRRMRRMRRIHVKMQCIIRTESRTRMKLSTSMCRGGAGAGATAWATLGAAASTGLFLGGRGMMVLCAAGVWAIVVGVGLGAMRGNLSLTVAPASAADGGMVMVCGGLLLRVLRVLQNEGREQWEEEFWGARTGELGDPENIRCGTGWPSPALIACCNSLFQAGPGR